MVPIASVVSILEAVCILLNKCIGGFDLSHGSDHIGSFDFSHDSAPSILRQLIVKSSSYLATSSRASFVSECLIHINGERGKASTVSSDGLMERIQ